MPRLPPAEKLPLALRKNVRDEWENKKADLEKQLSEVLGETWTFEANPNAIWPYHNEGYAKDSLGSCINAYYEGAIYQIKSLAGKYPHLQDELNIICRSHVLSLDVADDEAPQTFSYCGCAVRDGKLVMLFRPQALGTNIDAALSQEFLFPALNAAEGVPLPLSFKARTGIRADYDPHVDRCRAEIARLTGVDAFRLDGNFDDTFAKLKAAQGVRDDWEERLGSFTLQYFEGLAYHLKGIHVDEDDMVREGFNEAVDKAVAKFRIVDTLKYESYCEVDIEDGVLYLQTTPKNWATNIGDAAAKLMDRL